MTELTIRIRVRRTRIVVTFTDGTTSVTLVFPAQGAGGLRGVLNRQPHLL
jgi:hypothetical protein